MNHNSSNFPVFEPYIFDAQFWPHAVAKMWRDAGADSTLLRQSLVVVPDASMYVPFQSAWRAHAHQLDVVCVMPRMMTLLDWAKSQGASDLDSARVERTLAWMSQLQHTPQLLEWLAGTHEADVFAVAAAMVQLSDELSLHFLAKDNISQGEKQLRAIVAQVYDAQAGILARQELEVLLQCWRADVSHNTPVVRYLATLAELTIRPQNPLVYVLRNRPWSAHESWFWHAYAQKAQVFVCDVQSVAALHDATSLQKAWPQAQTYIAPPSSLEASVASSSDIKIYSAPQLEDEAQAVVRQVLAWRDEGLKKIALVALDRTVSRRVWALLGRCAVRIRDDTGWLLSTARSATSWQQGFNLWLNEVDSTELRDWLAHPAVLSSWPDEDKQALLLDLKRLSAQSKHALKSWSDWQTAARLDAPSPEQSHVRHRTLALLAQAIHHQKQFAAAQTLSKWVDLTWAWATDFAMLDAWRVDAAGQVWLGLLESWRAVNSSAPLRFAVFLRVLESEVEQATFRPHDVSDEVLLLPLGSTRMRDFDAVWLMGADASNLPNASKPSGLLNVSARQQLGLPTYLEQHAQSLQDLMGIFARTPVVRASYCATKEGAPNALSTWLLQWLRSTKTELLPVSIPRYEVQPNVALRSRARVDAHMPSTISATDLATLAACPYQFYAKKILGLRASQDVSDEIQAAEKGNLWHHILAEFHKLRKNESSSATRDADVVCLTHCIEELLQPLCSVNPRYWVVREVFLGYVAAYVDWCWVRYAEGWRVETSEHWQVALHDGLQWQGKVDEINHRAHMDETTGAIKNEYAIIDYKSGAIDKYKKDIQAQRDIQLAFYLNLFDSTQRQNIVQAGYVGVSEPLDDIYKYPQAWLNPSQETHDGAELMAAGCELKQSVADSFAKMREGQPLLAMGELTACQWCDVRGLCRKGYTVMEAAK